MGVASLDDVLPHVKSEQLKSTLTQCKKEHEKLDRLVSVFAHYDSLYKQITSTPDLGALVENEDVVNDLRRISAVLRYASLVVVFAVCHGEGAPGIRAFLGRKLSGLSEPCGAIMERMKKYALAHVREIGEDVERAELTALIEKRFVTTD